MTEQEIKDKTRDLIIGMNSLNRTDTLKEIAILDNMLLDIIMGE